MDVVKNIAILGGTFDPVHLGHLMVAAVVQENWLLPMWFSCRLGIHGLRMKTMSQQQTIDWQWLSWPLRASQV